MQEKCHSIMKRHVVTLRAWATVTEAAKLMRDTGCGLLPIFDESQEVVGVITDRDIVLRGCAEGLPLDETSVRALMTSEVYACSPDAPVARAEELMSQRRISRVLVLDAGVLVGIISLTDIAHHEDPLRVARVLRSVAGREYRVESR